MTKAPTAIENLTYTGGAQALTTRGLSKVGEMQYSLDGKTYSTDIPTGTDAGTYTVWYKAVGGSDYYDSEPQSITVTIAPKTVANPTISVADCTYNGQAQEPTVTVKDDLGNIIAPKEYEVSYSDNTNAGAGRVIVTDVAGNNYVIKSSAKGFPIDKAAAPTNIQDGTLNVINGTTLTYTELQLKSLEKILIARRARSSYETCFVISFLINHKTSSAVRRCLPD